MFSMFGQTGAPQIGAPTGTAAIHFLAVGASLWHVATFRSSFGGSWCSETFSVLGGGSCMGCCSLYAVLQNLNFTKLLTYYFMNGKSMLQPTHYHRTVPIWV